MPGITRVNLLYNMPPQPERPARDGKPARPAKPARPGRLAVAKSAFYDNFVWHSDEDPYVPGTDVPRLKLLHLASNATAAFNDEIDALVEDLRRWRDRSHPKPSVTTTFKISNRKAKRVKQRAEASQI